MPGAYGAGTAGKIIGDNINATISSRATQTSVDTVDDLLDTEVAAIKTVVDAILVDTAEIGTAGAGLTALATQASVTTIDDLLDTEVAAIKTVVDSILVDTAEIGTAGAGLTALATQTSVNTIDDFLDTEIAAIKAKTDNLPSDPADASDIAASFSAVNTKLDTIDDLIDTEIGAIKAETASIQSDTNDIQSRLPAALTGAGNMKVDVLAISGSAPAADNLEGHALRTLGVTFLAGGSTTTAVLDQVDGAAASSTDDVYNGRILVFSAPAGLKDQACSISDYVGATKTATITALTASVGATAAAVMA
jgi:hypothetical protein